MTSRTLGSAAAILVLAASGAFGQQAFTSAHWKTTIEVEGGKQGGRMPAEYEIWIKEGKMRMKGDAAGMPFNMLKIGDEKYTWTEGQAIGMKMTAAMNRRPDRPSADYVNRIELYRTKGKQVGSETIDGHPCEIWEYTDEQGTHGRYWLAKELKFFPVQAVVERAGSKITYHNRDIQIPAADVDAMMALPSDVQFQDMSEMMKGMPPKQ